MGTNERRERELAARHRLILDKSRELFFQKGFDNVSVAEICTAAEFGRSAVYALFRSKEEIYAHILLEALDIAIARVGAIDSQAGDLFPEFKKFAEVFFAFFMEQRDYFDTLFHFNSNKYQPGRISPQLEALIAERMDLTIKPMHDLIQNGVGRGVLCTASIERAVRIYWSSLEGIIRMFICDGMEGQSREIEAHCLELADLLWRGLLARPIEN